MTRTEASGNVIQAWQKDNRVATVTIMPQGKSTLVMITFTDE